MRIRKRQVRFPLSSLSPVPVSDPLLNLNRPPPAPVVQLHPMASSQNDAVNPNENPPHVAVHPQPSDRTADHHLPLIGKGSTIINGWEENKMMTKGEKEEDEDRSELLLQEEDKKEEEGEKGNHVRKENILGAQAVSGFLLESSSNSSQVLGRWCEKGERAFPPKKRRGMSFDLNSSKTTNKTKANLNNKKPWCGNSSSTTSTTSGKKDDLLSLDPYHQDAKEHSATSTTKETKIVASNNSNKNKSRGGALMEGSRCSRVNGRGWRCCQQTLVGYSLCEHHLGKGRLRSMTSVRSRSLQAASKSSATPPPPKQDGGNHEVINDSNNKGDVDRVVQAEDEDVNGNEYNDERIKNKLPLMANSNKKRMKLGMVKARSISSLLGQSNGAIPMADLGK